MNSQSNDSPPFLQLRFNSRASSLIDLKSIQRSPRASLAEGNLTARQNSVSKTCIPSLPLTTRKQNPTKVKTSSCSYGYCKAFVACTNQGLVRSYNEDRITIMPKLSKSEKHGLTSFFAIFDGHGGPSCADYLAENMHRVLARQLSQDLSIQDSINSTFSLLEQNFISKSIQKNFDNSGSCAISLITDKEYLYLANVGDSRGLIGLSKGKKVVQITDDHKPCMESEKNRIEKAGGVIIPGNRTNVSRVLPGRLSVSRTFGDISAKLKQLGGNPNVIISTPDIFKIKFNKNFDYLLLASDGVFDVLTNEQVNQAVTQALSSPGNLYERLTVAGNNVIDLSLQYRSSDNVTCIIISFSE